MTNSTSKSLSFPQAIAATQSLMEQIEAGQLDESTLEQEITSLISSKQSARGFFVAYLTSDMSLADNPSPGILKGLKSSNEVSTELLVKNLAMSSAMIVTHTRNGDRESMVGSQRVCLRTSNIIKQLESESISLQLRKLHNTIQNEQGEYQEFLKRWNYDIEQRKAIQKSISNHLAQHFDLS